MDTAVIGKVSVKVWPDTSGFKERAKAELAKEARGLEIEVPMEPDENGLKHKVRDTLRELQALMDDLKVGLKLKDGELEKVRAMLKTLDDETVNIKVDVDNDKLKELTKDLNKDLKEHIHMDVDVDQDAAQKKLDELSKKLHIDVDFDEMQNNAKEWLDFWGKAADQVGGDADEIKNHLREIAKQEDIIASLEKARGIQEAKDAAIRAKAEKGVNDELKRGAQIQSNLDKARSDAAQKIQDELKAIHDGLLFKQKIDAQISDEQAKQRADAERMRNAQKAINNELHKRYNAMGIENLKKANKDLINQVDDVIDEIDKVNKTKLVINTEQALRNLDKVKEELNNNLSDLRAKIKTEISPEEREKVRHEINNIKDQLNDLEANIKIDIANPSKQKSRLELAKLARDRIVNLYPVVNKLALSKAAAALGTLSGAKGIKNAFQSITDSFEEMLNNAPKVAVIATLIGGLAVELGAAATNAFSLAGSIATIAPAAFALPALLTGIASAAIVTVVAFSQMSKELPGVVKRFKGLKKIISDNFWDKAKKPIKDLAHVMMPELEKGFGKVAGGAGTFFGALAEGFKKNVLPDLPPMFDNLAKAIKVASKATDGISKAIGILGSTGSEFLPALAQDFADISNKFADFLTKAKKSGELKEWISEATGAIKELWSVATGAAGILSGLAKAGLAAGGSTLKSLGDNLHAIANVINSPDFQKSMTNAMSGFLKGAELAKKEAGGPLKKMFKSLSDSAALIFPQIGMAFGDMIGGMANAIASPGFQSGLKQLTGGLAAGFKKLEPYWGKIGSGLGNFADILGNMASVALPLLGKGLGAVGGFLGKLKDPLKSLSKSFGDFMDKLLDDVGPNLDALATPLGNLADTISNDLLPALEPLAAAVVKLAGSGIDTVASDIASLASSPAGKKDLQSYADLADALTSLFQALNFGKHSGALGALAEVNNVAGKINPVGIENVTNAIKNLAAGIKLLKNAIPGVGNFFAGWAKSVGDATKQIGGFFAGWATSMAGSAATVFMGIKTAINKSSQVLNQFVANFIKGFQSLPDPVGDIGKKIFSSLWNGMKAVWNKIVGWLDKIGDWIVQHKGPPAKDAVLLTPIGKSIMQGLWNGMKAKWSQILPWLTSIGKKIINVFKSAGTWIKDKGKALLDGFRTGVSNAWGSLSTRLKTAVSAIKNKFSAAGTWIHNKGSALINGFRSGVSNAWGALSGRLSSLISSVRNKFSNAGNWLVSKGSALINGLRHGVSAAAGDVLGRLSSLISSIRGRFGGAAGWLYGAGANIARGLANGIRAGWGWVTNAARNLASAAVSAAKNALGIHSPSKVFASLGEFTSEGFAKGIISNYQMVQDAAKGLGDVAAKAVKGSTIQAGVKVASSSFASSATQDGQTVSGGGPVIYQTNINPVAEPGSVKINKALQSVSVNGLGDFSYA